LQQLPEKDTKGNNGERGILIVTNLRSAEVIEDVAVILGRRSDLELKMMYLKDFYEYFWVDVSDGFCLGF